MIVAAIVAGYAIGSIPTADWIARAAGFDLRRSGTRNPGTANAVGLGGLRLGVPILIVDFLKGAAAAFAGLALADAAGAVAAAVAAVLGQVVNPWYRFRGGKGLAVTGGTALALFPAALVVMAAFAWLADRLLPRTELAVLVSLGTALALALLTASAGAPWDWSPVSGGHRVALIAGLALVTAPKFFIDLAGRRRQPV